MTAPGVRARAWGAVVLGALSGVLLVFLGLGRSVELQLLDRMQRSRAVQAESRVVIVELDARTVAAFGWPLDPTLYAAVVQAIDAAGARAVGLDVLLADRTHALDPASAERAPADELLGAVARETALVLGVNTLRRAEEGAGLPPTPPSARASCEPDPRAFVGPLRAGLGETRAGHVNVVGSSVDGTFRAVRPCIPVHDGCVRDLPSMMLGLEPDLETCTRPELVPYPRAFEDFERISLYELVAMTGEAGRASMRERFDDRYVIIGVSDPTVGDLGRTPAAPHEPLVTVHANRIDALASGRRIADLGPVAPLVVGILALLALAPLRLPARAWLALAPVSFLGAVGMSWVAFRYGSAWLAPAPMAGPLVAGALGGAAQQGWRHLRFNQMLTQAFGSYVSPDVLEWLQATGGAALDPAAAERREVTVLFSDIAGYTRLSNSLPPDKVLASLRLYLEAMVDVVQRHGGYLDKINGDGLMVVFGAPRPLDDAPGAAVRCALQMQEEVRRLERTWQAMTGSGLAIRVGIATGPAFVGNLGGEGHVEYTAIGPVVNLAARLESQAPVGGLLLSADTREALQRVPDGDWVDVALKGYEAQGPVRAWAVPPRAPAEAVPPDRGEPTA